MMELLAAICVIFSSIGLFGFFMWIVSEAKTEDSVILIPLVLCVILTIGVSLQCYSNWRKESVKLGHAEYRPDKDGEVTWQWKEIKPEK